MTWWHRILDPPSRYGPVATGTEAAASELGGDSIARTIFWLKVWNGLAYLAVVLALDRNAAQIGLVAYGRTCCGR